MNGFDRFGHALQRCPIPTFERDPYINDSYVPRFTDEGYCLWPLKSEISWTDRHWRRRPVLGHRPVNWFKIARWLDKRRGV